MILLRKINDHFEKKISDIIMEEFNTHLYNLVLAFTVFLIVRYSLAKYFTNKPIILREMLVFSLLYAIAYIILKKYGKSYYRDEEGSTV